MLTTLTSLIIPQIDKKEHAAADSYTFDIVNEFHVFRMEEEKRQFC